MNAPELYVEFFKAFWERAKDKHKDYVGTSRPHGQAASFESLLAFKNEVMRHPKYVPGSVILDAGAGASTALLRLWFGQQHTVYSCDPDYDYLADVMRICQVLSVRFNVPWLEPGAYAHGYPVAWDIDFTFYDYGTHERMPTLLQALKHTRHVVYVDDTDHRADAREMREWTLAHCQGWDYRTVYEARDEHDRFGLMLTRVL